MPDSQANVLWLARPGVGGAELSRRFERAHVIVAPGVPLGEPDRIRITVPAREDRVERLLRALEQSRDQAG